MPAMIAQEKAIIIASEVVRRERAWETRLCHVIYVDPSKYPAPLNVGKPRWSVVFWYPDIDLTRPMDPSTYAVHVDAESGEATLVEE